MQQHLIRSSGVQFYHSWITQQRAGAQQGVAGELCAGEVAVAPSSWALGGRAVHRLGGLLSLFRPVLCRELQASKNSTRFWVW